MKDARLVRQEAREPPPGSLRRTGCTSDRAWSRGLFLRLVFRASGLGSSSSGYLTKSDLPQEHVAGAEEVDLPAP